MRLALSSTSSSKLLRVGVHLRLKAHSLQFFFPFFDARVPQSLPCLYDEALAAALDLSLSPDQKKNKVL